MESPLAPVGQPRAACPGARPCSRAHGAGSSSGGAGAKRRTGGHHRRASSALAMLWQCSAAQRSSNRIRRCNRRSAIPARAPRCRHSANRNAATQAPQAPAAGHQVISPERFRSTSSSAGASARSEQQTTCPPPLRPRRKGRGAISNRRDRRENPLHRATDRDREEEEEVEALYAPSAILQSHTTKQTTRRGF